MATKKKKKFDNIKGHPGYYISKSGKLYTRHIPGCVNGELGDIWWRRNRKGYSLSNGKYVKYYRTEIQGIHYYIHRLVAEAWVPNPDHKPCVGPINNDPFDNRASNLYWCTQAENMAQMARDGRSLKKEKNPKWKSTNNSLETIGDLYASGIGVIEITRQLGLSKHLVQKSIQVIFQELWLEKKLRSRH